MSSSLSIAVRGEEEVTLIFPSLSGLKIIQCLQAIFQLVLKCPPSLHCKTVRDLLSKTFLTDRASWEPPESVYRDQQADRPKKISLSDLGDIPLSMFHQVMEKIETANSDNVGELESPSEQEESCEEDGVAKLSSSPPSRKFLKVDLGEYKLPKLGEKTCSVCQTTFKSSNLLIKHFVRHNSSSEKQFYFCKVCNQWATNNIEIQTHKHLAQRKDSWQSPPPPRARFKCGQCNKEFRLKHQLETHLLVHSGVKQFGCERCGKLFKQIGHLQAHVEEIHETNLDRRDFICNLCGKGFPSSRKLTYHLNYTHGDKKHQKYVCNICDKAFSRAKLRPHQMRDHENNLPFSCQFCEKRFVSKYYVTRHLKQAHKVGPS